MSAIAAGQPDVNPEGSGPYDADEPAVSAADRIAALRVRLITPLPDDGLGGWFWPLLVTVFAGILRFSRLSSPDAINFDETYYAKDAWSILKHGVEGDWVS